ncbi:Predicted 3'-5' exonuclease [Phaffia rhodozyma]|uniref:Predicted 3'-5' exonuclease n=1 Tax=Phaffia rhodozyma TaxID=264483 RepID=A0A0F7ST55_PHARH|nr:Predicted 3'-5' exonuclease [Phaffia rhodozyma]
MPRNYHQHPTQSRTHTHAHVHTLAQPQPEGQTQGPSQNETKKYRQTKSIKPAGSAQGVRQLSSVVGTEVRTAPVPSSTRIEPPQLQSSMSELKASFASYPPFRHQEPSADGTEGPMVLIVGDTKSANEAVSLLKGPIGLDIEWKPNFIKGGKENPTALMQLADSKTIVLIQFRSMNPLPFQLKKLLEDPETIKLGVGIRSDASKINNDLGVQTKGLVDLNEICPPISGQKVRGLAVLVGTVLKRQLVKHKKVTMSNWESAILNERQVEYASNDAFCAYKIYTALRAQALQGEIPKTWAVDQRKFDYVSERLVSWSSKSVPVAVGLAVEGAAAAAVKEGKVGVKSAEETIHIVLED